MRKISTLLPIVAIAMMVGCSKDNEVTSGKGEQEMANGAYLSLKIATPSTRADLADQPGTADESTVSTVKLLVFDKEYNYIGMGESTETAGSNVFKFEVAPDAYRFFVIANPTEAINAALKDISGNWNIVEGALQSVLTLKTKDELSAYTTKDVFPMVNAGSYESNSETILVNPAADALIDGKISTDKDSATVVNVTVDRMVAKFSATVSDQFKVSDDRGPAVTGNKYPLGTIDGVRLNVVNKKSYIYSHIKAVNSVGDDYRGDPNMSVVGEAAQPSNVETSLTSNFFWLHNYESPRFNPATADESIEYAFENTANAESFDYNNLTQLVVKATYVPTGQKNPNNLPGGFSTVLNHIDKDANSWFAINIDVFGTMQMTFNGVKDYYGKLKTDAYKDDETVGKMDRQLRHMLTKAPSLPASIDIDTVTWANELVTCALLNTIPNGGYVAATVADEADYIVQFYQNGLNYYDIFIQHDELEPIGHLGRWGMVRNNHYNLIINSLSGPGLPYIPDPTDPDIKDPQNPDPKDPEPADKGMAYINATIVVNPWTMWEQKVDLN